MMPTHLTLLVRVRRAWWRHVRRHDGEVCHCCGRPVFVWWSTDDEFWRQVVPGVWGLLCVPCFDRQMREVGTPVRWEAIRA
jgi:hypothetical protein